jgi:hypothetical protein
MTMNATTTTTSSATAGSAAAPAYATRGKLLRVNGDVVVFAPDGTTYELRLVCPGYAGPVGVPVVGVIRATARKAYTVPSGGNFVSPIYGPPRTIQGRVRALDGGDSIVVQAGTRFHVRLPAEASGVELANGPISVGSLVNVVALPGATFELVKQLT